MQQVPAVLVRKGQGLHPDHEAAGVRGAGVGVSCLEGGSADRGACSEEAVRDEVHAQLCGDGGGRCLQSRWRFQPAGSGIRTVRGGVMIQS
jgi:hypothetical protein